MTKPSIVIRSARLQGVALIIVLCFIALVTVLVVAYFSRTIAVRQMSNSSASATEADLLAQSATDIVLGDFKQEIVNGSQSPAPTPSPSPASGTIYVPSQAAYAVPQRNLPTPTPAVSPAPAVGPVPNLIRRSLRSDSALVPTPGRTSRASAAASSTASVNGRYVSTAAWNLHGLIPAAALTSSPAAFTAPDWVMVTSQYGPEVLTSPTTDANNNPVTVVGRYAYAVYDEGGLLDANHAGFPSASTFAQVGGKLSPGYADLTQLPGPSPSSSLALLTPAAVDNLLGWRNNATMAVTGAFPAFTPLPSPAPSVYNNYLAATTTNPNQVSLTYANGRTDQVFLNRQQLVSYFSAAGLDPSYLQYLTTFSRGLNQPSYMPEPTRPTPAPAAQGGNDANGNTSLNPSFLTVRAASAFARNDGSTAVVGEPLVKKRFALDRLAWLTFRGPIADANGNLNPNNDSGVAQMITAYNNAGISTSFLQQGTPSNVFKYFGLQWGTITDIPRNNISRPAWLYMHGQHGTNGALVNLSNPNQATDVVRLGREADFFELLKAAVNAGSIAKSSLTPYPNTNPLSVAYPATTPQGQPFSSYVFAAQSQYNTDSSVDTAILQMGANIIDQFDVDNYPTTIGYDLAATGSYPTFVCGVENLPYISRVRPSLIRLQEANPPENHYDNPALNPPGACSNDKLQNTGVAALMNLPEIWNPHDYGTTAGLTQVMGIVGPRNFQIYAVTHSSIAVLTDLGGSVYGPSPPLASVTINPSCDAVATSSPGFFQDYGLFGTYRSGKGGEPRSLTLTSTLMTFSTPNTAAGAALFREPTILFEPGLPFGSNLASPPLSTMDPSLGKITNGAGFFLAGKGLLSAVTSAVNSSSNPAHPRTGTPYIGFYLGIHPLRWMDKDGYTTNNVTYYNLPADESVFGGTYDVTFTLACEDGNGGWIPYDNKSLTTANDPNGVLWNSYVPNPGVAYPSYERGFGLDGGFHPDRYLAYYDTIDPRTSRFGMLESFIDGTTQVLPPYSGYGWVDINNNVMLANQSTFTPGYSPNTPVYSPNTPVNSGRSVCRGFFLSAPYVPYSANWASTSPWFLPGSGWYHNNSSQGFLFPDAFRPGLFAQNNPNIVPDGSYGPVNSNYPITTTWNDSASTLYTQFYYTDPDGVARRASGGNVPAGSGASASTPVGLATVAANGNTTASVGGAPATPSPEQIDSRPVILNRPFQSVAELGYVFSGTPWKNLDFFQPESGNAALLDMFCINDTSDANAVSAGQLNLNTRQVPVVQAVLSLANKDLWNASTAAVSATSPAPPAAYTLLGGATSQAKTMAQLLVTRTAVGPSSGPNSGNGPQPLQNISDLVGRWITPVRVTVQNPSMSSTATGGLDGLASCDGFTRDLATAAIAASPDPTHNIQRYEEAAIRALANVGQTRVWNLMFDIVAQTGRYPVNASTLDNFLVQGQQHYWVHVAIDRLTGQVLDKQVEVVQQ
jgi:Tfp pilus assembly protein PilX